MIAWLVNVSGIIAHPPPIHARSRYKVCILIGPAVTLVNESEMIARVQSMHPDWTC
jgi:hypothetical protein